MSSGSGDDHLLTAHADDECNKSYHDNRAFQFHNNNSLSRKGGKTQYKSAGSKHDDNGKNVLDVLDVVIVHNGYKNLKDDNDLTTKNICLCKHQMPTKQTLSEPRKRHNATQTPTSLIHWDRGSRRNELHKSTISHDKHCQCMTVTKKVVHCDCSELQSCPHHCPLRARCCALSHHSHHYSRYQNAAIIAGRKKSGANPRKEFEHCPISDKDRSVKRQKRCSSGRHSRAPFMYHKYGINCSSMGQLPNTVTKSSLDSSDDQNQKLSSSGAMQEIAIEIDAATMTEDNTTTATSNFAFKVAADSALAPIIRAPVHIDSDDGGTVKRLRRRSSSNSNTTIETDELSNEEGRDKGIKDLCYSHCCSHVHRDGFLAIKPIKNESVKIKRKRFIVAEDYCSSCSRCSSCSCSQIHSSSCSSFEEWHLEGRHSVQSVSHALTVSADCHHCQPKRRNSQTSGEDLEREESDNHAGEADDEVRAQASVSNTTDSSARTSRRSSVTNSFCSCNSNTCCYCSGSYDDSHTGHMCTARDATIARLTLGKLTTFEGEEGHSSTLTPLTNPSSAVSTPAEDGDVTICSLSNAFSEDTSSQSHSAEYFSLSSTNQISHGTPRKLPINSNKDLPALTGTSTGNMGIPNVAVINTSTNTASSQCDDANGKKERKPCKHYSKHHRHKRVDSPFDSYL